MAQSSNQTALRYLQMLSLIPKYPVKITSKEIKDRLSDLDYSISKRTIERDLLKLETPFGLFCDERSIPYGWSFIDGSTGSQLAAMDKVEALSLSMAKEYLINLLPVSNYVRINNLFNQANSILDESPESQLIRWRDKIRITSNSQPLIAPTIDPIINNTINSALLNEKKLIVDYKKASANISEERIINPFGLILQGVVYRVICTMSPDYTIIRHLPLHRFKGANEINEKIEIPRNFDIDEYISGENLGFPKSDKNLKIKLVFEKAAGYHLTETPLSTDQTIEEKDGELIVKATVRDTEKLRWWVLGFAESVKVLEPHSLKSEIEGKIKKMMEIYF